MNRTEPYDLTTIADFFDDAPSMAVVLKGRAHTYEYVNKLYLTYLKKDRNILGLPISRVFPEQKSGDIFEILDEVYATGKPYITNEWGLEYDKEGTGRPEELYFYVIYTPLKDTSGKVHGIFINYIDISEPVKTKKSTEQNRAYLENMILNAPVEAGKRLAHTEEKLRSAVEIANLGTWEYDLVTGEVTLNERLKEWRGIKQKGVLTINDIGGGIAEKEIFLAELSNALESGSNTINLEYDLIHPETGGSRRLHSRGKIFLNEEKKPVLLTGITQDITLQRLNETELENKVRAKTAELAGVNDDLRQLNENLEQFVYIASHDLQEPLRKINIFSDMLQKSSATMSEDGKMYISKIAKASKRMSLLINDLLEFSQVSSKGKNFIPTDLNRIISDVKVDYELLIKQKNATINISPLPVIEAIPLQMNQLFYNLIGNALKFSKPDVPPVITVSCEMLSGEEIADLKLNPQVACCKIVVQDNGIGFDQKYERQIFEIFQRLHGKHEYVGTGIGLSLARKIADNHGGFITATSEEGKGAAFNVILPVRRD